VTDDGGARGGEWVGLRLMTPFRWRQKIIPSLPALIRTRLGIQHTLMFRQIEKEEKSALERHDCSIMMTEPNGWKAAAMCSLF
jgi:hypothetical protein